MKTEIDLKLEEISILLLEASRNRIRQDWEAVLLDMDNVISKANAIKEGIDYIYKMFLW